MPKKETGVRDRGPKAKDRSATGDRAPRAERATSRAAAAADRAAAKEAARAERATASRSRAARDDAALIWLRQEPGARRPLQSRADIAQTAIELADADGLDAVSMRNVAGRLGAGTMTLYRYVNSKDELITLMLDTVTAEMLIPTESLADDWRGALTQIATRTRDAFTAHRWALDCLEVGVPGPNTLRHFEQSLKAVAPLRLSRNQALELIGQVDDYVYGFALRQSQELQQDGHRSWPPQVIEFFQRELETGQYPLVKELYGGNRTSSEANEQAAPMTSDDRFHRGLQRLLRGIEADFAHSIPPVR